MDDIRHYIEYVNHDLAKIDKWPTSNGICINPDMSKFVFIKSSRISIGNDILTEIDKI